MIDRFRTSTVFRKELVDNARDRKSWLMSALYVIIGPVMLLVIIQMAGRLLADENSRVIELPVIGQERAPSLMEYLKQRSIQPRPGPADPEVAITHQQEAVVLVVGSEYTKDLAEGRPAVVQLFHDSSRNHDATKVQRVRAALYGYGSTIGHLRLLARGIDPSVVNAVGIEDVDHATPHSRAAFLFGIIPIFLLMSLFVGGLYIAIDSTAGERERGSLEPLLLNPISSAELVWGKLAAVFVFSAATVLLAVTGFALVLNAAPIDIPRVRIGISAASVAWLMAILFPAAYLASALQMRLASVGRTFKEAQTAGQFLMLIPALPGIVELLGSADLSRFKYVPVVGQQLLIESVLKGQAVSWLDYAFISSAAILLGALLTLDTIRSYERTRVS